MLYLRPVCMSAMSVIGLAIHAWDWSGYLSDRTRLWKAKVKLNPGHCRYFVPTKTPLGQSPTFQQVSRPFRDGWQLCLLLSNITVLDAARSWYRLLCMYKFHLVLLLYCYLRISCPTVLNFFSSICASVACLCCAGGKRPLFTFSAIVLGWLGSCLMHSI